MSGGYIWASGEVGPDAVLLKEAEASSESTASAGGRRLGEVSREVSHGGPGLGRGMLSARPQGVPSQQHSEARECQTPAFPLLRRT